MRALFVGRFQPFHIGHMKAVEYVLRIADYIIIGVGSSQFKNTGENPFSYEERAEMIRKSLKLDAGRYEIKPIPDFNDEKRWVAYILEKLPQFDVVYTNGPAEKKIFRDANLPVRNVPLYERTVYNASDIRRKMSARDKWENLLPKEAAAVVKKVGGVRRITQLTLK